MRVVSPSEVCERHSQLTTAEEILPFDPLWALAELPEPVETRSTSSRSQQAVLGQYFRSTDRTGVKSEEVDTKPSGSKMTIINGCLMKKEKLNTTPEPKLEGMKGEAEEEEEIEEEEELEYDENDEIVGHPPQIKYEPPPISEVKQEREDEEEEEEEGVYSDNEYIAGWSI